jgi:hypothetical protein
MNRNTTIIGNFTTLRLTETTITIRMGLFKKFGHHSSLAKISNFFNPMLPMKPNLRQNTHLLWNFLAERPLQISKEAVRPSHIHAQSARLAETSARSVEKDEMCQSIS